MDAIKKGDS
jgi:hypothetical protein